MTRKAWQRNKSWAVILLLPVLLRMLVPVGFMPMVGPGFAVRIVVCEGYAPVPWQGVAQPVSTSAAMPMSMDMGADSVPVHGGAPAHDAYGTCPYGSAPALGALPALAGLPAQLVHLAREPALAVSQVRLLEASPRAQSPRGPPA